MSESLVVQLRQALAAWDDGALDVVATLQAMNALRAVLVHLEGEPERLAGAWSDGWRAGVAGEHPHNPYRREEQTND